MLPRRGIIGIMLCVKRSCIRSTMTGLTAECPEIRELIRTSIAARAHERGTHEVSLSVSGDGSWRCSSKALPSGAASWSFSPGGRIP